MPRRQHDLFTGAPVTADADEDWATVGSAPQETNGVPPALFDVPEKFHVHNDNTANWVVRKIVEARAYAERVKAWAEQEVFRAQNEEKFFMFRFGEELRGWTVAEIKRRKGKMKSLKLPAGSVGFRKSQPSLVLDNEEAVLVWARKECPTAIVTTPRIAKSVLNEHLTTTGEVPSGAHVEPGGERFYVRA